MQGARGPHVLRPTTHALPVLDRIPGLVDVEDGGAPEVVRRLEPEEATGELALGALSGGSRPREG